MEIFSMYMTLDVLQTTTDVARGKPFFSVADINQTQVILFDDHSDGPYFRLWELFSGMPTVRSGDVQARSLAKVVVPLPGASNPFWQGDWEPHDCEKSELLSTFISRVLHAYSVINERAASDSPLVITFIDRKATRRLLDIEQHIEDIKTKHSDVVVNLVDFAAISFEDQLSMVRHTDVLVGVHGAGLTHAMFLWPGSAVVEILPQGLDFKGFRNLAKLSGVSYFSVHTTDGLNSGDWQDTDVAIDRDRLESLVDVAIKSQYNRGLRSKDVIK